MSNTTTFWSTAGRSFKKRYSPHLTDKINLKQILMCLTADKLAISKFESPHYSRMFLPPKYSIALSFTCTDTLWDHKFLVIYISELESIYWTQIPRSAYHVPKGTQLALTEVSPPTGLFVCFLWSLRSVCLFLVGLL